MYYIVHEEVWNSASFSGVDGLVDVFVFYLFL